MMDVAHNLTDIEVLAMSSYNVRRQYHRYFITLLHHDLIAAALSLCRETLIAPFTKRASDKASLESSS